MDSTTPLSVIKEQKYKLPELPLSFVLGGTFLLYGILYHAASFAILGAVFSYDRSSSETVILMNIRDVGYIVMTVLGAIIIPRWSARKIVVGCLSLMTICAIGIPFLSHNFTLAELLFALTGGSFALVRLAAYWLVSLESNRRGQHARRVMHLEGMYILGVALSYGVFLPYVQDIDSSWTKAYWTLLPFIILVIVLQFTHKTYPPPDVNETWKNEFRHAKKSLNGLISNSIFVISLFCIVLIAGMYLHFNQWTNVFADMLLDNRSYQFYNLGVMAIIFAVMGVSRLIIGVLLERVGRFLMLIFCSMLFMGLVLWQGDTLGAVSLIPTTSIEDTSPYSLFLPAMAFSLAPMLPLILAIVISQASDRQQPLVIGLLLGVGTATQMLLHGLSTASYEYFVNYTAFYFILIPLALLLVLFFLVYSDLNRDKRLFHRRQPKEKKSRRGRHKRQKIYS